MKSKKSIFGILSLALLILVLNAGESFAQPSNAQIKKQLTGAKTVSVTLGSPGTIEWSSTYKKYVWTRNFTAKLRTDTPGEFLIVKGYAAYDVMGGRYVFWRTFTSSNNYEGKKNPTVAEINQALETAELRDFSSGGFQYIGEYESLKMSADPRWEWHTPDSVSFDVVAVFSVINKGGSYGDEPQYQYKTGFRAVDKIEAYRRLRLYRKAANQPWSGVGVSQNIPTAESKYRTRTVEKLLARRVVSDSEAERMKRITKVPSLTQ